MKLALRPLPLLRNAASGPLQTVSLILELDTAAEVTLRLAGVTARVQAPVGRSQHRLEVPAVSEPTAVVAEAEVGGGQVRLEAVLEPVRPWQIHVVHHSHVDLGYTDPQPRVFELHSQYFDHVLEYCRRTEGWPVESRFRWNVEVAWPLKVWLEDRPASVRAEFIRRVQTGQIEVTALGLNVHSEVLSPEELARLFYDAAAIARETGVPLTSAFQSDIPGQTWVLPQLLNGAGVRYLALAPNNWRAPFHDLRGNDLPRPFWWEGRDGSRVLTWFTDAPLDGYQEANLMGFVDSYETVLQNLPEKLAALEADGFPYDLLHLRCQGGYADNGAPNLRIAEVIRQWNEVWEYPQVRMALNTDFFAELDRRYGDMIPSFRADWPDWWVDGVGSAPRAVGTIREAHERLAAAEGLHALLHVQDGAAYPAARLADAWENTLLFDEHTFGAAMPLGDSLAGMYSGGAQWEFKAGYAHRAFDQARRLEESALQSLASTIQTGPDPVVLVYNSLPFSRTAPVELYRMDLWQWAGQGPYGVDARPQDAGPAAIAPPQEIPFELVDMATGQTVPLQAVRREPDADNYHALVYQDRAVFLAPDVPAFGYKTFAIRPRTSDDPSGLTAERVGAGAVLETPEIRLVLDAQRAGIASVLDKALARELVPAGRLLNQYIFHRYNPSPDQRYHRQTLASEEAAEQALIRSVEAGPVMVRAVMECQAPGADRLITEVTLWKGLRRVDIANRLMRQRTAEKEAVYIAFPLAVPDFDTHLQTPGAFMRPRTEQLPGSCSDWYCVHHAIDIAGPDGGVMWATIEAPLVQLGAITTASVGKGGPVEEPTIYSYAVNNLWSTNFVAAPGGEVSLRYSLAAHQGGHDEAATTRFGADVNRPLSVGLLGANRSGSRTAVGSLCRLEPENVQVVGVKRAEDGNGLIIRLAEMAGRPVTASLSLSGFPLRFATLTSLLEEDRQSLAVDKNQVSVPLAPYSLVTVRVR